MSTQTYTSTLTVISCGECHVTFGLESSMYRNVKVDGSLFWCPNGHRIGYHETDEQRLRKQVTDTEEQLAAARSLAHREAERRLHAERQRAYARGQVTKMKRRVGRGVCPCCNRTFADLARHMEGQHPEFADTEVTA